MNLIMEYTEQDKPENIPIIFTEAWNNRDAGKIASLFEPDADFINVTGLWWHKRDDIEKAHAYGLKTIFNHSTLSLIRTKVKYLSESVAVVHAKMKLNGQTPMGTVEAPGERKNLFTFVVHKTEENWWCVTAQNTDIVPGKETHIRDENGRLKAVDYRNNGN